MSTTRRPEPRKAVPSSRRTAASNPLKRRMYWRRRALTALVALLLVFFVWLAFSMGGALLNPALGGSFSSRLAEWGREHGGASIVNWAENEWYSHHPPPIGGTVPRGEIRVPSTHASVIGSSIPHLPTPAPLVPFASPALPGEGEWSPVGRRVDGVPAIFVTTLRPDAVHTSYVVGVAWMDTKLLRATLYSGSWIPGGGPWPNTAPVQPHAARSLVAAFNAGFLMSGADGGYYTDHKMVDPLRVGAASFVVYRNGTSNVIAWGRHDRVTPDIVSVRQNLDLLVNDSKPVAGLVANDTSKWGATVGNAVYVSRSGLGVTADGALVYVGGPGLNITDLANLLVRAGAVRAMELDINVDWVNYSYYTPSTPDGLAAPANGRELVAAMTGTPARYFESWWARDFITMSARMPTTKGRT